MALAIVPERTVDLLDRLLDYIGWLGTLTLEEELQSIVAPLTKDTMAPAILARLGWEGLPPVTLQAASEIANVTRERIRQVQNRIKQVLGEGSIWAPVLDRVLEAVVSIVPTRPDRAVDHLLRLGLITQSAASVDGIIEAQRVLGRTSGLRLIDRSGFTVLTTDSDGADALLGEYDEIRVAAQKRVNNQGIATLDEIRQHLAGQEREVSTATIAEVIELGDGYRVVAGDHVVPASWDTRNALWNRLAKMLCLASGLPVEMAAWQLGRDDRRGYPATPETLRIFVGAHPELELRDDGIHSSVEISEESVLSDSERTLVALFRDHGPELSFTELVPLALGPTFTRVTLAVRLASSPVIVKLARNRYRLLTAIDRPSDDLATVVGDLSEIMADPETDADADADADARAELGAPDGFAEEDEPNPEPERDAGQVPAFGLPRLVMAPGVEVSIRLPDAEVAPVHQVIADLFAGRLRWPAETRRQRWSATRLPDLLEAIYHGLPLGPLVVQRQVVAGLDRLVPDETTPSASATAGPGGPATVADLVIVDGQQRLAWLARLFNPHYRIPGQPQLAPIQIGFQLDTARFSVAGPDSAADPFLIPDIGPLVRAEVSPWRITSDYLIRLRRVRSVDEITADRLATAIMAVSALREAHLTIQPVSDRLHPEAVAHLYDRLHRS